VEFLWACLDSHSAGGGFVVIAADGGFVL
jgi:hypothetical protein